MSSALNARCELSPAYLVALAFLVLSGCADQQIVANESTTSSSVAAPATMGDPSELVTAEPGDVVTVELMFDECRGGDFEAFGVRWRSFELLPLEWQGLSPLRGEFEFENAEVSLFTFDGVRHEMTFTGELDDECIGFPQDPE